VGEEGRLSQLILLEQITNRLLGHLKHLLSAGQVRLHTGIGPANDVLNRATRGIHPATDQGLNRHWGQIGILGIFLAIGGSRWVLPGLFD